MAFADYEGMLTNGLSGRFHRALLYSTGLDWEDLGKPMIAVVNSSPRWYRPLSLPGMADFVKQGIIEVGASPEFSTIAICDGICQAIKDELSPALAGELIADLAEYM